MKKETNEGITLIALVITIIILLILAGISIASLTGENGILRKANTAAEENKKAEYEEILKLIGNGLRPEKVLENLSAEEYMKRYKKAIEDEISKAGTLEGATVINRDPTTLRVITKEGYVYEITEDEVSYVGKQGENPPPTITTADIDFILDPEGYTNTNVTVEIRPNINMEGFTLQYSRNTQDWTNYTMGDKITYTENGWIYARLINPLDEVGGSATKPINTIDRDKPNEATIVFNKNSISAGETLTATVTQSDEGTSGLDLANCRYIFTTTETELKTDDALKYTDGNFTDETQTLTLNSNKVGACYLHILSVDNAGNKRESISKAVTIRDTTNPNDAVISFDKTTATVGDSITATVTQSDDQSRSKYSLLLLCI